MNTADYNHIVNQVSDGLFRYALKLTRDTESAKDLVQESFIRLWTNREKVETDFAKPFLFKVLFNKMIDDKRKNKRISLMETLPEKASANTVFGEDKNLIEYAFAQLDEKQKNIILLRDWEGYKYDEIAEILQISLSLVKVNLFRARKKMQQIITNTDLDAKKEYK